MADFELEVVRLFRRRDAGAEIWAATGLARPADIVALALDGHQRGALDRRRLDQAAAHPKPAERQVVALEHALDRLQIEIRRQVHHRAVFVVEGAGRRGTLAVAAGEVAEHRPMRRDVAVEIHAEKAGELQKARIDAAEGAGIARRHGGDHGALEPVERVRLGEAVDRGRVDARCRSGRPSGSSRRAGRDRRRPRAATPRPAPAPRAGTPP